MENEAQAFLGVGWAFPVELDRGKEISAAKYDDDIRQAIWIILGTAPGERVMRPDFGAGLHALAFEPINSTTMALLRQRVEQALTLWEPRIDSVTVQVSAQPAQGRLMIDIRYRVRTTNTFYNVVYPFYLQEGEQA